MEAKEIQEMMWMQIHVFRSKNFFNEQLSLFLSYDNFKKVKSSFYLGIYATTVGYMGSNDVFIFAGCQTSWSPLIKHDEVKIAVDLT